MNLSTFSKSLRTSLVKHSPEILTGIGIAGMITSTILAVKATPKALTLIAEAEDAKFDNGHGEALTKKEVIKAAWKPYIPAISTAVVSTACLVGSSSISVKRNAALATAYQLSKTALSEYKEKVVEEIGEKKEKNIREKVAQEKVHKKSIKESDVVVVGSGDVIFVEPICGKAFKSEIEHVRKVINDLNYRLLGGEEYIALSEFYDEVGLKHTKASDSLGWNLGRDGQIEVDFLAAKTEDGKPCLMLEYQVEPRCDYSTLY